MKLGIIIDSSIGLSKQEATKAGYGFLPLYLTIDEKEYADGETISNKEFYNMASIEQNVRTSATPTGVAQKVFDKMSKQYDEVIVYPLSGGLSSQAQNLSALSNEYKNVHVIKSNAVGRIALPDIQKMEKMAKEGLSIDKIVEYGNSESKKIFGIAIPASLKWLVKGGRVSPAVARMSNLLKIVPMIKLENGKLDKYGKGRILSKTALKAAKAVKEKCGNSSIYIYEGKFEGMEKLLDGIEDEYKYNIRCTLPPIISTHTGPEIVAFIGKKNN